MYRSFSYPTAQSILQLPLTSCLLSALQSGGLVGGELFCDRIADAEAIWLLGAEEAIGEKLLGGDAGTEMTDAPVK